MKSLLMFTLSFLIFLSGATSHAQKAQRRLNPSQIRSLVNESRDKMSRQNDPAVKKAELEALQKRLQSEFEKGAASYDATYIYVNKVLLDLENILYNDCKKSRSLITNQTLGQDPNLAQRDQITREMSEGLALHNSYCTRL
jgi:hypothetical protein